MYLATAPSLFTAVCEQLAAAGLNTPNTRLVLEKPLGHDLASNRAINARGAPRAQREPDLPHRPLPGQAVGAEPVRAALRQRAVRAAVAARDHRQHPDHDRRGPGRGKARRLLRQHRSPARHGAEPRAAAAVRAGDGAADQRPCRRHPRRKAQGAALAQALDAAERSTSTWCAASTWPARSTANWCRAIATSRASTRKARTETFVALRTEIANWRWAGVPFYIRTGKRLAAARRAHRGQLPADAARDLPLAQRARPIAW